MIEDEVLVMHDVVIYHVMFLCCHGYSNVEVKVQVPYEVELAMTSLYLTPSFLASPTHKYIHSSILYRHHCISYFVYLMGYYTAITAHTEG